MLELFVVLFVMKYVIYFWLRLVLRLSIPGVLLIMKIEPYRSVEMAGAKALCGEVMIPFDESIGLMPKVLVEKYQVSQGFAKERRKLENKNKKVAKKKLF